VIEVSPESTLALLTLGADWLGSVAPGLRVTQGLASTCAAGYALDGDA
jgi:hypothetical protein